MKQLTNKVLTHAKKGDLLVVTRRYILKKTVDRSSIAYKRSKLGNLNKRNSLSEGIEFCNSIQPWKEISTKHKRNIRAAVILDKFSESAFDPEWAQVSLTPSNWKEAIDSQRPDLLFVESAWHGHRNMWTGGINKNLYSTLKEIVDYCQNLNIPTAFWNKEDPAHYEEFIGVAKLFDHVFTTDSNKIEQYCLELGHKNVSVLPFAAQPTLHNPRRPLNGYAFRDIAFAGTYFSHKFPSRREQMSVLLEAADKVGERMDYGLEIFSRFETIDSKYRFPDSLSKRVIGSIDYERILSAYHLYKVFLNVNSVTDSPTMCSRRIFEILASGSSVVSTPSQAINNFFPASEVVQVSSKQEAEHVLTALVRNKELREHMIHLAQRRIWSEHTYQHRVTQILETLEIPDVVATRPKVSAIVSTNRPHRVTKVIETVASMNGVGGLKVELCLLAHGFKITTEDRETAEKLGLLDAKFIEEPSTTTLGGCYNKLINQSTGDVLAKIDDDDFYGENYLSDQVYALSYSGADVVGKQAHFTWFAGSNCTSLTSKEREHKQTQFIAGPTIVARRKVMESVPFRELTCGEDTQFLKDVIDSGGTIYSSDRYNFVRVRGGHDHTWALSDWELLSKSDVITYGIPTDNIFF